MRRLLPVVLGAAVLLALAGCGGGGGGGGPTIGGKLGTVPKGQASKPVTKPSGRPIEVQLQGRLSGTARLRPAAQGQKTAVSVKLAHAGVKGPLTVALAHGACSKPTALTSTTVLGRMHGPTASWTTPAPFAQLIAGRTTIVVHTPAHVVAACGAVRRG